jgi:acyl dehydratase
MIDRSHIGLTMAPFSVTAEPGRLRFFARAIGETNPVYFDEAAARAAGHPGLPLPPTFLFTMELDGPEPFGFVERLGIDLGRMLHGEQSFHYHRPAHAGETLTFTARVADIFDKKGGALTFVVRETAVTDATGAPVADLITVLVVRNPGLEVVR